jgi:oligosaccharide repeat unit polymerase
MLSLVIIFGFFAFGIAFLSHKRFANSAAPLGVFGFSWFGVLAVANLPIVDYTNISIRTWLLLVGAGLAFVFGALSVPPPLRKLRTDDAVARSLDSQNAKRVVLVAVWVMFLIGLLGTIMFLDRVEQSIGWKTMFEDRRLFLYSMRFGDLKDLGLVGVLLSTNQAILPMATIYLKLDRRLSPGVVFILVYSLLVSALLPGRTALFVSLSWSFFVWLYIGPSVIWRKQLVILALLGLTFSVLFVFAQASLNKGTQSEQAEITEYSRFKGTSLEPLTDIYVYGTGSLPAFDKFSFAVDLRGYTWGFESFGAVLRMANLINPNVAYPETVRQPELIPFPYNTFTFLDAFYSDFGTLGILVGPLIMGIGSQILYKIAKEYPHNFLATYSVAWAASILVSCFNVNRLTWVVTWYYLVIGVFISLILTFMDRTVQRESMTTLRPLQKVQRFKPRYPQARE